MLSNQIQQDLQQAQLNRDEVTVSTLRMLLSELSYARINKGTELEEAEVVSVVQKELKKRKEAAEGFRKGDREEAALKEESEAQILSRYLPQQLSDEELTKIVEDTIKEVGAKSVQDMGKVIGMVMGKVKGQAEGGRVSGIVREKLLVS